MSSTKQIMSIVVGSDGRIEATYSRVSAGVRTPAALRSGWPQNVKNAARKLVDVADGLSEDDPMVKEVQVYGPDQAPKTGFAKAGDQVDLRFEGGGGVSAGVEGPVPTALASARDALKEEVLDHLDAGL